MQTDNREIGTRSNQQRQQTAPNHTAQKSVIDYKSDENGLKALQIADAPVLKPSIGLSCVPAKGDKEAR